MASSSFLSETEYYQCVPDEMCSGKGKLPLHRHRAPPLLDPEGLEGPLPRPQRQQDRVHTEEILIPQARQSDGARLQSLIPV